MIAWLPVAILGVMLVEFGVLAAQPRARRARLWPTMLAGFFVVVAWALAAWGVALVVVLAALGAALVAHGIDVKGRWKEA